MRCVPRLQPRNILKTFGRRYTVISVFRAILGADSHSCIGHSFLPAAKRPHSSRPLSLASASLVSGMASGSGHRRHRNGVTGYNFSECCKSALPKERERDELVDGVRGNQSTFPSSFGYFRVRLGRARVFFFFSCFENVSSFSPSRPDDGACFSSKRASLLSTVPLSPSVRSHSQKMSATFL